MSKKFSRALIGYNLVAASYTADVKYEVERNPLIT